MTDYVSTHDKIRHEMQLKSRSMFPNARVDEIKEYKTENIDDIAEIKLALKFIMEKLTQLDCYVRGRRMGARVSGHQEPWFDNSKPSIGKQDKIE